MNMVNRFLPLVFLLSTAALLGFRETEFARPGSNGNVLRFGEVDIPVDTTDCSTDNSNDGKSRSIAAINSATASMCTIQFGVPEPSSGTYITTQQEPIGATMVIVGIGGTAFGGAYAAKPGQSVTITNIGGKYRASFKDLALFDPLTKEKVSQKLFGNFGCDE